MGARGSYGMFDTMVKIDHGNTFVSQRSWDSEYFIIGCSKRVFCKC